MKGDGEEEVVRGERKVPDPPQLKRTDKRCVRGGVSPVGRTRISGGTLTKKK